MASVEANTTNGSVSAAQRLMQQHAKHDEAHQPTIEDVPDEEDLTPHPTPVSSSILESTKDNSPAPSWAAPMSAKAAGKQKATGAPEKENKPLDTQSEALFPGLGSAPKTTAAPIWAKKGTSNGNGVPTNGSSTPNSGVNTPPIGTPRPGGAQSLAGQVNGTVYTFGPKDLSRAATKKPLPEILRELSKKHRVNLSQTTGEGGVIKINLAGNQVPEAKKKDVFRELGSHINTQKSINVPVPRSVRAHIIGKGGSTIKSIQQESGAKIQLPKVEDTPELTDEEDDTINIVIDGNPIAVQLARAEIEKIASARGATVNTKLRNVPAELYPFILGANNSGVNRLERAHGVQVQVPQYHRWTEQAPPRIPSRGQAPAFLPAHGDNPITLAGDRAAVMAARSEIERLAQDLQRQLTIDQFPMDNGRHQFIIGPRGVSPQDFYAETNCAIILPDSAEDDMITIIGPADQIAAATDKAQELGMGMQVTRLDVARLLRNVPSPQEHARNLTHYFIDRLVFDTIDKVHQTQVNAPLGANGESGPWDMYSREGKNAIKAQTDIRQILEAHPPDRVAALDVDDFFHKHLNTEYMSTVKNDYGVHLVIPQDKSSPLVLVYEGEEGLQPQYGVPRGQPSPSDIELFRQRVAAARKYISDSIAAQGEIIEVKLEVPTIFHQRLRKYIKDENSKRPTGQFPVRVHPRGPSLIGFSGPKPAVESLVAKVEEWLKQAKEDEKGRGFTLSFEFPQKHAKQLIGKGGSNITELREKFDVDIQLNDEGVVELKGPKAKAEAARAHITSLGKQWADETTYTLKIEPKFHSELIGAGGSQIKKLEKKYKNVQIRFPHSARPARDDQSVADGASDSGRRGARQQQEPDEVIIRGPKKGADEVRAEILDLLQYTKDNSYSATVSVQAGQIGSLIGQRGAEMDKVRSETGAKIDVPNARDHKDQSTRVEISIKGTKSQVDQAKKIIEEKKAVFDNTVSKTVEVDKKHHRALIGAKGATIDGIVANAGGSRSNTSGQTVQFPKADADGNLIKVTGTTDVVDKIIANIEQLVTELESRVTDFVDVPSQKHSSLIGRGGDVKRELESTFKVSIDVPRQNSDETNVKITGLPADVEKAKSHIASLVKEQEGETMQVPRSVHHSISDNGQFFRQLRNNHKVTVDVNRNDVPPKPAAPPANTSGSAPLITDEADDSGEAHEFKTVDLAESGLEGDIPWVLRGQTDSVAKARAMIEAAIEQALQNTTIGYLSLPNPDTYRFVIGRQGAGVNAIRKATGCKITVPRERTSNEAIEIVGSAEGVEQARDMIIQAVMEGQRNSRS
ncbi:Eukaryotic type KH-domain (KH-domain type I) [Glarea lozoyensis ATCC 20868]|uniref:Eukaryotic type KH-domain (KH-domain type I) n=1 Tax=Glarea lozoyensis (strain ATCC 20868 / MF5171) TaxID=1116229 RepID=S3CJT4_GLAL2|nr:Eukaryotic type KH-domain (KH-domain type I) [Glarea lozoyensis ATCC 20868]EPE25499.1 Eukaryotic type KH-domain (KH-domain type I) [Glarea lozoyensis ATCC 20868]